MFESIYKLTEPKVIIGSLVMYTVLVVFCIYAFIRRSSMEKTTSLYHTLIVAVFGMLNSIFPLQYSHYNERYTDAMGFTGLFFGGTLTPLTWMVGITIFLSIATGKRPLLVLVGYFFTLVQFVLLIVYITFYSKMTYPRNGYSEFEYAKTIYLNIYISIISINWGFFLLFFALVIQHRHSVSKTTMATLIIFGVLNIGSLIVKTVLSFKEVEGGLAAYLYLQFFFTDFASAISLYMSILCWKDLKNTKDLTYTQPEYHS